MPALVRGVAAVPVFQRTKIDMWEGQNRPPEMIEVPFYEAEVELLRQARAAESELRGPNHNEAVQRLVTDTPIPWGADLRDRRTASGRIRATLEAATEVLSGTAAPIGDADKHRVERVIGALVSLLDPVGV